MTRLRDNRGGVLVLAAVMIPVFLLLTALVIDAGNWFTHKRQLQNRADAAAFAAGVAYAQNWRACVQDGDMALKTRTAQEIANVARQYAADPEAADYALLDPSGVVPAALYNDQIAQQDVNQANNQLDVVINSGNNDYTDDTDYTDDYDVDPLTRGTPCFSHPSDSEKLSAPGHWTDVKVTERDTAALWEPFSPDLHARARIEIRPALSGNDFLPIAVPDNLITKVQIRYYDECTGAELAKYDLAPLPAGDYNAYTAAGGGSLWALPSSGDPAVGDKDQSFALPVSAFDPADCPGDYRPISEQVRVASDDDVDLDQACGVLQGLSFADCFTRLSQIRIWNDGNADSQPRVKDVQVIGGCGGVGDGYFGTLPIAATDCSYDVEVDVDWGTRDDGDKNVDANFTVEANGTQLTLQTWDPDPPINTATYASSGGTFTGSPGPNDIHISVAWEDTDPTHNWQGNPCGDPPGPADNPCVWDLTGNPTTENAHRTFVGKNSSSTKPGGPGYDPAATGAVEHVHTSLSAIDSSGAPGPSFANWSPDAPGCAPSPGGGYSCPVFPTVGIRSALKTGTFVTLRLDDPLQNQTLRCDPDYAQGQEFGAFLNGCGPWYGRNMSMINGVDGPWWDTATKTCPINSKFFSYSDLGNGFGVNSSFNPWWCVPTAQGMSTPLVGEGLSVATDNCSNILNNQCQQTDCLVDGNYDGDDDATGDPWIVESDSAYPRVVNLFIIPYQSMKNIVGNDPESNVPILGFASFYVMNWTGSNTQNSDQCPDSTWGADPATDITIADPPAGAATGVFVETVKYESGPVDLTAVCEEGQLTPCRPILVR